MRRNPWRKILVLGSIVSLLAATPGVDLMASELPESYGETSEAAESNEAVFSSAGTDNRNLKEMPDTECIAEGNDLYSGVVTGNNEANTGETFDETIQVTQAPENMAVNSANSDIGDSVPFESELSGSEEIDPEIGTPASEAGLDVITVTNSYTVTKAIEKEGVYESSSSGKADIVERSFDGTDSSETVAIPGYDLYDADSAYMVTHDPAGEINLKMNYGEISFSCEATAGNRIVFDKKGYIELLGESSDYLLGMYSEDGYPTKWSSIEAFGNKACRMSLLQTENGYILSGDVLSDVLVKVKNDTESATVSFSSPETSALICEADDEGVDVKFDTDSDGNYETSISEIKSIEKASVGGVSLSYGYTGKAHTPAITVKVDGVTLVKDIDYTAEYENNIEPGTARITVTGKGKYKDTKIKTFKIADCVSTLKSGKIYQIVPKNNPGTAMCPVLGKTEKNTKIYITNRSASKSLKFKALKNSDGTWKFVNVKSGRVLAVQQNSSAAGAGIVLYDSTTRKAQNWKLSKKADNSFAIVNSVTGYSISVSDQSVVRGTTLKMAESARSGLQRFYFTDKEYEDDDNDTGEDELLPSGKEDEGNTGITSGVTVTTNAESIEISEPTVKLYGLLGKIGGTGLQSMAVAGKYIYTYAGTSGRFYRTPLGELNPVSTLHTMEDAYIIDKGNGMTSDGTNLYLTGANNMVYTVPISAFNAKSGLKYSKATNIGVTLNGICYDSAKKEMYGYRKDDTEKLLRFYKIDLSAQKNRATAIFQASWSEAIRYDQDMEVIGNYFYVVSDYPGSMVKISKSGKVVQSYRLSQYTDRGAYTGEFEGIVGRGDRILLASAYTGYLSADSVLPAIGSVNPKDNVTLRQSRTIVFSEIDPVKDITPYDPYMRGAVAMQKAVVYVNWNKNTFKPDGTEKYPFPSPVTAFNARKNPRYEYIFKIVKPELDVNDRPFMIIGNQKDVTIDLSKECSNSKGIMSLYIYNSRITLSSSTDFRISYLVDSDVNYVSSPKYCKSVMNYDKGNNSSRFNCAGQMSNDFGSAGSTPNGNYVYNRQIGNSSGSPIALPNTKAVRLPAGKTFHISVLLKSDGATYYGSGFAIRGKTYLTLFTGTGDAATVELGYDSSKDSVYISRIRRKSAKSDETDFSQVVLSVNMA